MERGHWTWRPRTWLALSFLPPPQMAPPCAETCVGSRHSTAPLPRPLMSQAPALLVPLLTPIHPLGMATTFLLLMQMLTLMPVPVRRPSYWVLREERGAAHFSAGCVPAE